MNSRRKIVLILVATVIALLPIFYNIAYASSKQDDVTRVTLDRINEIRSTKNTDVSNITGKVYYVSNNGNDNNDGLTVNTPIKTLSKVNALLSNKTIKNGDAVLFKRGDIFRGYVSIKDNNLTFGSYGDESLPKPKIYGSEVNAAKEGSWVEVFPNIWKYQKNNQDKVFTGDIGGVWFFCEKGNDNCSRTTTDGKSNYSFGQKRMSYSNMEETDGLIKNMLMKDLDFYNTGHSSSQVNNTGLLYVYSIGNPSERFDDIEISRPTNGFGVGNYSDVVIDNIDIEFFGRHAVGAGSISNLKVTNCEISYIGGQVQSYNAEAYWPVRYGNGIEVYGNVEAKTGYPIKEGFVAKNNYIYEIYDAGLTFQYTAKAGKHAKVEKVLFEDNVVEYCSYNIEYWNTTEEREDTGVMNETYINKVYFRNNILRYAGIGFTETRPEHGYEALIKSWDGTEETRNTLKDDGEFIIEGNILDTTGALKDNQGNLVGTWMIHVTSYDSLSLPIIRNNVFLNYRTKNLGYYYSWDTYKYLIPYNEQLEYNETLLKDNEFIVYDKVSNPTGKRSGTSNEVSWNLDLDKRTLTISGNGKMADYTLDAEAPWSEYNDYISNIVIGENVTYLGKRAFANTLYVQNIYLNATNLTSLAGNNETFYNTGKASTGTTLYVGENVTIIPAQFANPRYTQTYAPFIRNIVFKGNKLKVIDKYAFDSNFIDSLVLPESVEEVRDNAFAKSKSLKVIAFPSKVTKLSKNVLKGSNNLEAVILGKNMTTAEEGSLMSLPKLTRLVIPNENITMDPNVVIMDQVYKFGIQLFGPAILEEAQNQIRSELGVTEAYYIPMSKYQPVVYGDLETFYVMNSNTSYASECTYEAKAYKDAEASVTGAKYRYMDRFKHIHLIDAVDIDLANNKINNMLMDVQLEANVINETDKEIDDQNVLYLGNSFTTGFGTQGMAASDVKYDYYYNVNQYLSTLNPNIKPYRTSINPWEENTSAEDRLVKLGEIIDKFNQNIDPNLPVKTIFIQLGENINSAERRATFESDFDILVKRFKQEYPLAKIYIVFNSGIYKDNKTIITNVSNNNNLEIINYKSIRYSYIGAKYYKWSHKTEYVNNEGVAWHPGDYGFVQMADYIISYLKEHNYSTLIEKITSNNYTITNGTIYVRPSTYDYKTTDLASNITYNGDYEIYNSKDEKVSPGSSVGTGYKVKTKNYTYKIIVLGDVTGDGKISLGDISKLYNHYRGKIELKDEMLEAGKVNRKSNVSLGDLSKLYNFYKGKLSSL